MAYGKSQGGIRREDAWLLTGRGRYLDDLVLPGMVHAAMVYSDHPHGRIVAVDTAAALAMPGVIAAFTGADAEAGGLHPLTPRYLPQMFGFGEALPLPRPSLATDKLRHVGDRVAVVVAETRAQAEAAAAVEVQVDPLPHAVSIEAALAEGAAPVHDERPDNVAYRLEMGDRAATEAAFASAASVHRVAYAHPRVAATSLEGRCGIGMWDPFEERYTLHTSTQNPHLVRAEIANVALHVPETAVRVLSHDVGGGFGMKTSTYPEDPLLPWLARQVGRPVKWVSARMDALRSDDQGRGNRASVAIALDADARLLGMRVRADQDVGAYMVCAATMPLIHTARLLPGVYDIPAVHCEGRAVFTNQTMVVPYRGAGRPEGNFAIEQALDRAARDLGLSPVEIRRRNFIAPDVVQGDTDRVAFGRRAFASRSVTMVGNAVGVACDRLIERGKDFAAMFLEAHRNSIRFDPDGGVFQDSASNKSMTIVEVAQASFRPYLPVGDRIGLAAVAAWKIDTPSFSNGCHVAEVVVDPDTGAIRIDRYTVVDDVGNMLEPALCVGQIHGAVAMGIEESLLERIASDEGSGALQSGSLMDYALPRADNLR